MRYRDRPVTNAEAIRVAGKTCAKVKRMEAKRKEIDRLEARLEHLREWVYDEDGRIHTLGLFSEVFDGVAIYDGDWRPGESYPDFTDVGALGHEIQRTVRIYATADSRQEDKKIFCVTLREDLSHREITLMLLDPDYPAVLLKAKQWVVHGDIVLKKTPGGTPVDIVPVDIVTSMALAQ